MKKNEAELNLGKMSYTVFDEEPTDKIRINKTAVPYLEYDGSGYPSLEIKPKDKIKKTKVKKIIDRRDGGHPLFFDVLEQMKEIHAAKNSDYNYNQKGPLDNFKESEKFGVDPFIGVLIRLSDKYARVKSLCIKENMTGEVRDESIEDTLIDLANYAILAIVVRRENR